MVDIAGQELGLALGIEHRFNWESVLRASITAGVQAGFGAGHFLAGKNALLRVFLKAGAVSVTQQLADMSVNLQDQFSFQDVANSMLSAGIDDELDLGIAMAGIKSNVAREIFKDIGQEFSGFLSDEITNTPFNLTQSLELMAANEVGQMIGNEVGNELNHLEQKPMNHHPSPPANPSTPKQKPAPVSTLNGPNAKNMVRQKASMYHRIGLFNRHQHRVVNKAKTPSQVAYAQSPSQHTVDLLDPLFVTKKLGGAYNAVEISSGSKSQQVLTGAWKGLKEVGLDIWHGIDSAASFVSDGAQQFMYDIGHFDQAKTDLTALNDSGNRVLNEALYKDEMALADIEHKLLYPLQTMNEFKQVGHEISSLLYQSGKAFWKEPLEKKSEDVTQLVLNIGVAVGLPELKAVREAAVINSSRLMGAASKVVRISKNKRSFFNKVKLGAEKIGINASSSSEIAWGYGKLSANQAKMLDSLTDPGDFLQLHKSYISPTDLAALTAHTGDEFGLFTLGGRRIIVRGTSKQLLFDSSLENKLLSQGWKWSAHTHPGLSDNVLMASGIPGDRQALQLFNQNRSLILNSAGRRSIFDLNNDYAITNESRYESSYRPGGY